MYKHSRIVAFPSSPLQKIPKTIAEYQKSFQKRFPAVVLSADTLRQIEAIIGACTHLDVNIELHSFQLLHSTEVSQQQLSHICFLPIYFEPLGNIAVLQIDPRLAHMLVYSILHIKKHTVDKPSRLSNVEKGLLLYVCLQIIRTVEQQINVEGLFTLKTQKIHDTIQSFIQQIKEDEVYHQFNYTISANTENYFCKLFLPGHLAQRLSSIFVGKTNRQKLPLGSKWLKIISGQVRIEFSSTNIQRQELLQLTTGDIIIFEHLSSHMGRSSYSEPAYMRIGLGTQGSISGILHVNPNSTTFEVTALVTTGEVPNLVQPSPISEESMTTKPDYKPELESDFEIIEEQENLSSRWLADIPVQLTLEMARIQLTADQIIQLRAGHLLELQRKPSDPINLTVEGKVIATGELVEIDGSLGVRIISITEDN